MCTGLRVIDRQHRAVTIFQRIARNLTLIIPLVGIVEYFVLRASPEGLRWGDRLAETRVVDKCPPTHDRRFLWYGIILLILVLGPYLIIVARHGYLEGLRSRH